MRSIVILKHFKEDILMLHTKNRRGDRRRPCESAAERIYLGGDLQRQAELEASGIPEQLERSEAMERLECLERLANLNGLNLATI
jgi:hypothetical protein